MESVTKEISPKTRIPNSVANIIVLLITLAIIEICFQVLARIDINNTDLKTLKNYTMYKSGTSVDDDFFKRRFIKWYDKERTMPGGMGGQCEPDSELGWVSRKNLKITTKSGKTYTTNSMGFRSLKEYNPINREKYVVVIVGDSFTYGSDADDSAVWPTLLQELDNDLEVVNLGVAGFGTDQMYLMLKKHIAYFKPNLVIAAVYWDDVYRSLLSFRSFQKPKFELQDGELFLTNTPISGLEKVYENVKREMGSKRILSEIQVLNVIRNVIFQIQKRASEESTDDTDYKELNAKIFQGMLETCQQYHADFLLLYVPASKELIDPDYPSPVGDFLEEFATNNSIRSLNPRGDFLKSASFILSKDSMIYLRKEGLPENIVEALKPLKHKKFVKENEFLEVAVNQIGKEQTERSQKQIVESLDWQYRMGHYDKKEATILASAVYEKIKTLPSYPEVGQEVKNDIKQFVRVKRWINGTHNKSL